MTIKRNHAVAFTTILMAVPLVALAVPGAKNIAPQTAVLPPAQQAQANAAKPVEQRVSDDDEAQKQTKAVQAIAAAWLARPELQRSYVGLEVMDIPSGRVMFSHNGSRRFVSASIAKVFTTACAYDTFGPQYMYRTSLVGYGELHGTRFTGPLVIVPSQDPSFSYEDLRQLMAAAASKMKTITGGVMISGVAGGGDHFSTEWLIQDWGQDWMPASSDLVVDRNIVPARDPARGYPMTVAPSEAQPDAMTRTLLQGDWASAWVSFNKNTNSVVYNRPDSAVTGSFCVANPTDFNTAVAKMLLKNQGVKIENHDVAMSSEPQLIGDHRSKPLSELIRFTLKESDNLYAQQLLRTLGTQQPINKALEQASLEQRGLVKMNGWFSSIGVPSGDAILFDGCGLSRKNAVAPHALNVVLRHMAGPTGDGPFMDLMIHDGEGAARNFRYKTGAMDSVRSISGVVRTATGHPLAVTAIINDHNPSVRELRTSLGVLIDHLKSMGSPKFKPAEARPRPASRAQASSARRSKPTVRSHGRRHRRSR